MDFETTETVCQKVKDAHGAPKPFHTVFILKNEDGLIGGYVLQPKKMDAPIPYLDCHGESLAMFHIFGSAEEKEQAEAILGPFREQFPIEEPLLES